MHVMPVVGARPQFIKLAPFSAEVRRRGHRETIVHTGQHYDEGMSARFFAELAIPEPDLNLGVGSGSHGEMTARALEGIERLVLDLRPDAVVVFGDTNSTLAGALAAAKAGVFCAHVEAGLRSFDRRMPEEVNRIVADHCCDLLFAPTDDALGNLRREGLANRALVSGDIMVDALLNARDQLPAARDVLAAHGVEPGPYALLTLHRAANVDDPGRLRAILTGVEGARRLVFPVHPRTAGSLARHGIAVPANVATMPPLGHFEVLALVREADAVVTDSGGLQKEAYLLETPCITVRDETEWVETVRLGWNVLAGAESRRIRDALAAPPRGAAHPPVFGEGDAAARIVDALEHALAGLREIPDGHNEAKHERIDAGGSLESAEY
ncbi:MAG: UDP-N-acetylglucosamine 2-epimerase (non-hydrolyzing) [Dehalococcoidia bacterium]